MPFIRVLAACLLLLFTAFAPPAQAEKPGKPLVIYLQPFGIPHGLFGRGGPFLCLHQHKVGTRLFWLDSTHLFAAFTVNTPCTLRNSAEPAVLRGLVFDTTTGVKIAQHDWTIDEVGGDFNVFPGPGASVVVKQGARLDFLDVLLHAKESGELDTAPRGLWSTPAHRTIPLLTADGRVYEFYAADPLRLLNRISLDASDDVRAVKEWIAGDERIAGSLCTDKSQYSCTRILVETPDAKFLDRDGAPWSYAETEKPVALAPLGFLDATHLVITREDKNFFHDAQMLIVTPTGARIQLPPIGSFYPRRLAGVSGNRFGIEMYALGSCANCIVANEFVVAEPDTRKFLFEERGTPYMSVGELSPDGKWMAILDNDMILFYPMPQ
ncbi:hypothetical protein [Silvibacterium dinghuense]|uniref:Phytase-like domain-containing protein n=1 Tax=Silvibacterium dinghuense TaxID=1560006 RepID=A0A4Q1SH94_9BACT|nr:hypothetical protein [Silvibacterium dinghuense]RXS96540.1 hypothetical protein ESZ00_00865 [Silvibacterium dinghuense]GGG91622.1 hypothetical protein GCM10011586_02800 [Silvibacterium dinghuense]